MGGTETNETKTHTKTWLVFPSPPVEVSPSPANGIQMLANTYWYKIKQGNQGGYEALFGYIGMCDRTPTLDQHMEYLTTLDMSFKKWYPSSAISMNTNTTTNTSARIIYTKKHDKTGPAGMATDDSSTCYECGQVGHVACNCPNSNLIEKLC